MVKHCEVLRRTVHVVNLDPAAEHFNYPVLAGMLQSLFSNEAYSLHLILMYLVSLLNINIWLYKRYRTLVLETKNVMLSGLAMWSKE